jgi:hypothetical protein
MTTPGAKPQVSGPDEFSAPTGRGTASTAGDRAVTRKLAITGHDQYRRRQETTTRGRSRSNT